MCLAKALPATPWQEPHLHGSLLAPALPSPSSRDVLPGQTVPGVPLSRRQDEAGAKSGLCSARARISEGIQAGAGMVLPEGSSLCP